MFRLRRFARHSCISYWQRIITARGQLAVCPANRFRYTFVRICIGSALAKEREPLLSALSLSLPLSQTRPLFVRYFATDDD